MRLRINMNSKEISKLMDRLEDALIAEHRLIKENVMLKEKVLDYAERLDRANDEIDRLVDRVEELEEELSVAEWQRSMDLSYANEQMFELEVKYQEQIDKLVKRNKELVKILYDIGVDVRENRGK